MGRSIAAIERRIAELMEQRADALRAERRKRLESGADVRVKCLECEGTGSLLQMGAGDNMDLDEVDCYMCGGRGYQVREAWHEDD